MMSSGQVRATMLHSDMGTISIFNSPHVSTYRHSVAKRTQHVALNNAAIVWRESANAGPTMLGCVVLKCCYRLAGALGL